ncbi:MAG: thiamine diphosphokinase [Candidatus Poseidoniaceae archaeon]|jgi:thiamine pyrophosphokinase|nr:thiamine diphosphokinase [Candidatus Poseidoniaceae archaeon]
MAMNGGHWLICADGTWPIPAVRKPLFEQADVVVACDGAYDQCLEHGILAHVVLGDMDSVENTEETSGTLWVDKTSQEKSDLSKAFEFAQEHDAEIIDVIGVEGGALGHQIAPLFALYDAPSNTTLHLDQGRVLCVRNSSIAIDSIEIGSCVSVFALGPAHGVHLRGCQWGLDGETLQPGTQGLNNKATQSRIEFTVEEGAVLLCIEPIKVDP